MTRALGSLNLSMIFALLGLTVSVVTLFLTQLRAPHVSSVIGPNLQVYYPADGGFGIYLPVTFLNESPRTGVVRRCGVSIYQKSSPDQRFFMEWRFFMGLNPDLSFKFESGAYALAVPGKSSLAKTMWLTWRSNSAPELVIAEGEYVLVFHYWTGSEDRPQNDVHEFYIDRATKAELDGYRASKDSTVVNLLLDKKIPANRLLTSYESRALLGD